MTSPVAGVADEPPQLTCPLHSGQRKLSVAAFQLPLELCKTYISQKNKMLIEKKNSEREK